MKQVFAIFFVINFILFSQYYSLNAQSDFEETRWSITNRQSILWDLTSEQKLPHKDNIEMSGKNISAIIHYEVDENKNVKITRDIIFPQLRTYNKPDEPDWKKYRAYFRKNIEDNFITDLNQKDKVVFPTQVDSIEIGGMITFYFKPMDGIQFSKTIFPDMDKRLLVENWTLKNLTKENKNLIFGSSKFSEKEEGYKGEYTFYCEKDADAWTVLTPKKRINIPIYFGALMEREFASSFDMVSALKGRKDFLRQMGDKLLLKTPDKILNTLFYFSKIRSAESIFESSMGLVHSPGGGNYYCGIWANDQIEYSGPYFPNLNYERGNIAAYNAYKMFLDNIPKGNKNIAYAFEMDGNFAMTHLDRGDAAMIAYGTSKYVLSTGNEKVARELWPLIKWSLDFCHKKKNKKGAITSASDEMEGRIETGDANLSTSALYFGGLKFGSILAKELGYMVEAKQYDLYKDEMEDVIENFFGAELEGLATYKYFKENVNLRHWICLPLCMGINKRKEATLQALFGKLWTTNGVLVEYDKSKNADEQLFWDRATLYALRGALKSGEVGIPFDRLKSYSQNRLLGEHVPYAVEAYPENNMKHLSAESALYCRIFIEGLLGIEPSGLDEITINPHLPADWDKVVIDNIALAGIPCNIKLEKKKNKLFLKLTNGNKVLFDDFIVMDVARKIKVK